MRSSPEFPEHGGCRLAYARHGKGPSVVFIQGTGVHGGGWLPQVVGLKDRFHCVTFDNRGMGLSQPVAKSLSVEQMAEDTLAVMDACGIHDAHLVGHSLGGLVAQQVALIARHRVRSLALLNSFARGAEATRLTRDLLWLGLRSRIGPIRARRTAFLKMVMPDEVMKAAGSDVMAAELAPLFGHDLGVYPPVVMKQMSAMGKCDLTEKLAALGDLPTLVVGAALDRIARPDMTRALAAAIPGATFVEFPNAGHALPIQLADEVNELLGSFLDALPEVTSQTISGLSA